MRNAHLCAVALALTACASDSDPDSGDVDSEIRKKRDAGVSTTVDAAPPPPTTGTSGGTVSCYTEGAPSTTCTLPVHCCFTNYSAQHNGACTTDVCSWGTIDCDGPEDCGAGQRCCSHAIVDPILGVTGYKLACQSDACGAPPRNEELCHAGTCSSGACVSAYEANYDLPRTLSVCR